MLILDLATTPERVTQPLPINNSQSGEWNGFWMSVEMGGNLAVVLDTLGSHRVLAWTLAS